jgi:hypothetical protein
MAQKFWAIGTVIMLTAPFMALTAPVTGISVLWNDESITIDGIRSEPIWQRATASILKLCGTGANPVQQTLAWFAWDSSYLYLFATANDTDVWSTITKADSSVWAEEAIEFFFDPDGDGLDYFEIDANPKGTITDLIMTKPWGQLGASANYDWQALGMVHATAVFGTINNNADRDTGYTFEARYSWGDFTGRSIIPLPPKPGDTLRANVYRIDGRSSTKEMSCLSPTETTAGAFFHTPSRFAKLYFESASTQAYSANRFQSTNPVTISMHGSRLSIHGIPSHLGIIRLSIINLFGQSIAQSQLESDNAVIDLADVLRTTAGTGMSIIQIFSDDRMIANAPFIIPHQ